MLSSSTTKRPISVLCLITSLSAGGAQTMLYRLMSRLDRAKFKPQVVSMMDLGPVSEKIRALGIPVRSLGMSQGMPNPLALLKLVRWLQCDKPAGYDNSKAAGYIHTMPPAKAA